MHALTALKVQYQQLGRIIGWQLNNYMLKKCYNLQ